MWHQCASRSSLQQTVSLASPSLQWVPWVSVPHLTGQRLIPLTIGTMFRYDCQLPISGSFAFAIFPRYLAMLPLFVFLPRLADRRKLLSLPGVLLSRFTFLLPALLTRRQLALPSSRATLMNTCPALRSRWCSVNSPSRVLKCLCLGQSLPYVSALSSFVANRDQTLH